MPFVLFPRFVFMHNLPSPRSFLEALSKVTMPVRLV
jgi:hypothetical protein